MHSNDVVNAGFIQGETSHIVVQVVYDERAVVDDYEGVDITRLTRELSPKNPFGLNLMRITVDGEPIDDPNRSSADIQRCTDVALDRADIQFQFDNLQSSPRLSVAASPTTVTLRRTEMAGLEQDTAHDAHEDEQPAAVAEHDASVEAEQVAAETQSAEEVQPLQQDPAAGQNEQQNETQEQLATTEPSDEAELSPEELQLDGEVQVTQPELQWPRLWGVPVYFRMYANYAAFIDRAEVRIFAADQSLEAEPLDVIAVDPAGLAEWQPTAEHIAAPMRELKYVLRAYGEERRVRRNETAAAVAGVRGRRRSRRAA